MTHLIVDNLELIHEIRGPVFPQAAPQARPAFDVPESLRLPLPPPFYWREDLMP